MLIPNVSILMIILSCNILTIYSKLISQYNVLDLYESINTVDKKNEISEESESNLKFYGKLQTPCEFDQCFSAVVAAGRTNFVGDGGDLANIYVPPNDYDTWKQFIPYNDDYKEQLDSNKNQFHMSNSNSNTNGPNPIEGEFIYQLQNDTLSCLTIQLKWMFTYPQPHPSTSTPSPHYQCMATPLAMNWDCHLDWGLTTECSYNTTDNQINAVYTVTNMGPEQEEGSGKVIIINKHGDNEFKTHIYRQNRQ